MEITRLIHFFRLILPSLLVEAESEKQYKNVAALLEWTDRSIQDFYNSIMSDTDSCTESEASNARNLSNLSVDTIDDAFSFTASVGSGDGSRTRDLTLDFAVEVSSSSSNLSDRSLNVSIELPHPRVNRNSLPNAVQTTRNENQRVDSPVAVIDLEMPAPIQEVVVDDDEVIFVSSNVEYIDLSTPTNQRPIRRHMRRSIRLPSLDNTENVSPPKKTKSTEAKPDDPEHNSSQESDIHKHLQCSICLEIMVTRLPTVTECGHIFCGECICEALRITKECPICRRKLTGQSLIRVHI